MKVNELIKTGERTEEYTVTIPAEYDDEGNITVEAHEEICTRTVPIMEIVYRDMKADEEKELFSEPCEVSENSNPLKEMAQALSTATSLAQMRAAAKAFLIATE